MSLFARLRISQVLNMMLISIHKLGGRTMKVKYFGVVLFVIAFTLVACAPKTQQQQQENGNADTIIVEEDNSIPDREYIVSLIGEDLNKRNWAAWIDTTPSPLFYKTIHDDSVVILYRVIPRGKKTCVAAIEDINIGFQGDYIEYDDSCGNNWQGYEHRGNYEIINDSTVNVHFETIWTNYCATCDSSGQEYNYYIKGTHRYKLAGLTWERIKADTTIVIDEREHFCQRY